MANWCSNVVMFEGELEAVKKVKEMFISMEAHESVTGHGQKPNFIKEVLEDYFFYIYVDKERNRIEYETKWSPNIKDVQAIADHFGLSFKMYYEESGSLIYGETYYDGKELKDVYLEGDDYYKWELNEETDTYLFEGEEYYDSYEIKEILLKRKLEALSL